MRQIQALSDPAQYAAAITPNDSTDLPQECRSVYVGVAGNIHLTTVGGSTVTLAVVAGMLPISVRRVYATGTTATGLVALW